MILRRGFRYIPFLLVCGIIAGGVTYLIARSNVTYTASSTIAVSPTSEAVQLVTGSSSTSSTSAGTYVTTEVPFLSSQAVAQAANAEVESRLHSSLGSYTPSADADAQTLTVTATSSNRAVAALTANAVLEHYEQLSGKGQTQLFNSAILRLRSQLTSITRALRALGTERGNAVQARRSADTTSYQTAYAQLQDLLNERGVPQAAFSNISSATANSARPSSTKKQGLVAFVLGIALAALLALARELALGYVRSAREVAHTTPNASMLARIPSLRRGRRPGIVEPSNSDSEREFGEALRRARVQLGLLHPGPPVRSVLIASPDAKEGRSLIASNLAAAWARTGRRVLLVASDLRHPDVSAFVGRPEATPGLTDLLARFRENYEQLPMTEVHDMVSDTEYPNLSLLASGTILDEPMDLLETELLAPLIDQLATSWDVVVFDSSPLLQFGDAALLADKVDAVILVATLGRTRSKRLRAAFGILESIGVHNIYTVANRDSGDPAPALNPGTEQSLDNASTTSLSATRA